MPSRLQPIQIPVIRGRNATDRAHTLPDDVAQECQNVDFFRSTLGRRRPGSASDTAIFPGITWNGQLAFLQEHMPDEDGANRELWAADEANTSTTKLVRRAGATTTSVVLKDAILANGAKDIQAVSFNGKFYLAYPTTDTDLDRLHVWDPGDTEVRRVGLPTPGAHTDTSVGTGSGLDFERFYRIAWVEMLDGDTDGTVERRSELSDAIGFTPNTSASAARVTHPTVPGEHETHWELYADTANTSGVFYRVKRKIIDANTSESIDDTASSIADYNTLTTSDDTGANTPPKAARFLVADEARILAGGSFLDSGRKSRIEFTPVLGDRDIGDDERIVLTGTQKNVIELGEGDGSGLTGLKGPIFGAFYAFKYNQVWKLVPTGVLESPYRTLNLSRSRGCIDAHSLVMGNDETGTEALYFMSIDGPYRIGARGLEYLGYSVEDHRPNLAATERVCHALYVPNLNQIWFAVATGSSNAPNILLVFDTHLGVADQDGIVRRGWSVYTGKIATTVSSTLMSRTLGASMSLDLAPYLGDTVSGTVLVGDDTTVATDDTNAFRAYIKTKAYQLGGLSGEFGLGQSYLLAEKGDTATEIEVTVSRNFGREARAFVSDLSGDTESSRVVKMFETDLAEADHVEFTLGDSAALDQDWELDAFESLISPEGVK